MNITRENTDALNGIIRVSIEKADYESKVADVLKEYRKKANMPGFRPGKIPVGLINKMYGKAAMVEEINKILTQELSKYLVEEKLNIFGEPLPNEELQKTINWEKDSEFEFVFDIGFAPEVKVNLDKKNKFIQHNVIVSDEMIKDQAKAYTSRFGESKPTESVELSGTVRGNIVELDAEGNEKEEGTSAEMALLSIDMIKDEDIKNEFIGKKVDDTVIFDIKKAYPNDTEISYLLNIDKEEVANLGTNFKVTIKEISKFVEAEINEELFTKIYGDDTEIKDEKAFHEKITAEILEAYKPSSEYRFATDARNMLISINEMEFPVEFLKRWLIATNKELTTEQIEKDFDYFVEDLKWQVIKDSIIKENELKVEEADVIELAKEVARAQFRQYGMMDVPDEHLDGFVNQMISKNEDRNRLFNKKMEDKIMDVVKSKVTVEVKEVSKEDFEKLFEK